MIVDQFVVSGRSKWGQTPSLALLLPHGYEGQGPEHSSARLERFLQLAAADDVRIVYPSTAGQYFHLLRRQAKLLRRAPRPLVVLTPKSLLRNPLVGTRLDELATGAFHRVLDDPKARAEGERVERLILCSGKMYFDLFTSGKQTPEVAIVRLEQLFPFPEDELSAVLSGYPGLKEVVWAQEEPRNMGAWNYAAPRLLDDAPIRRAPQLRRPARDGEPLGGLRRASRVRAGEDRRRRLRRGRSQLAARLRRSA